MMLAEIFNPAGHAVYITASYAISFVVLLLNILVPLWQGRRLRRELRDAIRSRKVSA